MCEKRVSAIAVARGAASGAPRKSLEATPGAAAAPPRAVIHRTPKDAPGANHAPSPWDGLPVALQARVLSSLAPAALLQLVLVSKQFGRVVLSNLSELKIGADVVARRDAAMLLWLQHHGHRLRRLVLHAGSGARELNAVLAALLAAGEANAPAGSPKAGVMQRSLSDLLDALAPQWSLAAVPAADEQLAAPAGSGGSSSSSASDGQAAVATVQLVPAGGAAKARAGAAAASGLLLQRLEITTPSLPLARSTIAKLAALARHAPGVAILVRMVTVQP